MGIEFASAEFLLPRPLPNLDQSCADIRIPRTSRASALHALYGSPCFLHRL
jgi:hypothetical protein